MTAISRSYSGDTVDPAFWTLHHPPADETEAQKVIRLANEATAKAASDRIDAQLSKERNAIKRQRPIKILLLGQSESGKSTTLKNFQLMNSIKAFHGERASWRAVIQYNVVRSIRLILEAMTDAHQSANRLSITDPGPSLLSVPASPTSPSKHSLLTPEHLKLKLRLMPLLKTEEILFRRLCPHHAVAVEPRKTPTTLEESTEPVALREAHVNSLSTWKSRFLTKTDAAEVFDPEDYENFIDWGDTKDPGFILQACSGDMLQLWRDPIVQQILQLRKIRVEEVAGFFLDAIDRVATPKYIPTDDDVLRARIKTLGVTEYRFTPKSSISPIDKNTLSSVQWRIYDVGGQRSLRAAWAPYFDDVHAIIFLAAISCFDQVLAEDDRINRLEDSVNLWKSICSNELLKRTNIVLFLNKCDILKSKLESGIRLNDFVVSYGRRPNDFESVSQYFRKKFAFVHKDHSPMPRPFYAHFTSLTDIKATKLILNSVQDTILADNLKNCHLVPS